jgi:two-component system response regulator NreC
LNLLQSAPDAAPILGSFVGIDVALALPAFHEGANQLRLLLVDGSEVFRMGLRAALAAVAEMEIVAEADTARGAESAARAHQPELIVADVEVFGHDAFVLASELRAAAPAARILVLAGGEREAIARQATMAGAGGCVSKVQPASEILAAMREVAAGRQPPAGRPLPDVGLDRAEARRPTAALARLSAREREIFDLIIWGQTNKQVAARLGISVKTVETHRSHINGKLQVHSAAELVRLASLCGVLGERPALDEASPAGPRLVAKTA